MVLWYMQPCLFTVFLNTYFSVQELCTIHRLDASKMASEWMAFKLSHEVKAIDIDCLQNFEREVCVLTEAQCGYHYEHKGRSCSKLTTLLTIL